MASYSREAWADLNSTADVEGYMASNLKPSAESGKYVCPYCGSGTRSKGTGAFCKVTGGGRQSNKAGCHACGKVASFVDLVARVEGLESSGNAEQLEAAARAASFDLSPYRLDRKPSESPAEAPGKPREAAKPDDGAAVQSGAREAAKRRIDAAAAALESSSLALGYVEERGFTAEEARSFRWGWDADGKAARRGEGWTPKGRLILPYPGSRWYYAARSPHDGITAGKYDKPSGVGSAPLFNPDALQHGVLLIAEGELDAFALMACGFGNSTCMGGAAGARRLAQALKARRYRGICAVIADADEAGRKSAQAFADEARGGGLRCTVSELEGAKDCGELFARSRDSLRRQAGAIVSSAEEEAAKAEAEAWEATRRSLRIVDASEIAAAIYSGSAPVDPIPTGIEALDAALGGGLYPGLTVLGAMSSMGKTTLLCQVADHIAASGHPVLFATLEQSGEELVGLSLRRLMASRGEVLRPRELFHSGMRASWQAEKWRVLLEACEEYTASVSPHISIMESREGVSVADVRAAAEALASKLGTAPAVFVDYLQLLKAPEDARDTRAAVDANLTALRLLSNDIAAPVVVISSLNRSSYSGSITMASFKESGSIEYSADTLLGLQPYDMEASLEKEAKTNRAEAADRIVNETKRKPERDVEVVIIKQRGGALPDGPVPLQFAPARAQMRGRASGPWR